MRSKLSYWCDGLIEAGLLAAIISAPLFFNIHSDRVFEPDKLTLVRSIALITAAAWLVRFVDDRSWRDLDWLRWNSERSIWRTPFVLPIFLLVVVYLLSTIFSVVPKISWAGSYQRLQGTYTTLSYVVLFAVAAATLRRRDQISRIVTAAIITSIPIALYGILQHYGLDPLPWGGNVQRRVAGHMGNAIFIAAYLIMVVPLTAARVVDAFTNILNDEKLSYADVVRSSVYIFTLAIQLVTIYWSGSRGPLLGLLVGLFAFILVLLVSLRSSAAGGRFGFDDALRALGLVFITVLVAFPIILFITNRLAAGSNGTLDASGMPSFVAFVVALGLVGLAILVLAGARRGWRWLWLSWMALALLVAVSLGIFNIPEDVAEDYATVPGASGVLDTADTWRDLPTVGRFGRLLEADQGTGRVRVLIWEGALDLITPHDPLVFPDGSEDSFNALRPILGYGPESMYVAYNPFYVPELATVEARNASPDRSHNETFDALVITGALGFVVWQILYLSVFYYGFRWLRVVRTKRDRYVLFALWIGGAILGAIVLTQLLGAVYIGIAIPFGSIGGLVLYLVYYALFAGTSEDGMEAENDPFQRDRLLMMGLVAAVVAHYVEIHFGIAIASTRVHFFIYVALMLLLGYVLPRTQGALSEADLDTVNQRASRRRRTRRGSSGVPAWFGQVLGYGFVLSLVLGILGYEYMNYAQPPGVEIQSVGDVPSAGEILHQAFFVNPGAGFVDSPYIYLLIVLTWGLGTLVSVSELIREGILGSLSEGGGDIRPAVKRNVAILFVAMPVAGMVLSLLSRPEIVSSTRLLGQGLSLIWTAICLGALATLVTGNPNARSNGAIVATIGALFAVPVMIAGAGLYGLLVLLACGAILYLLWVPEWNNLIPPALILGFISFTVGVGFALVQASQLRNAVFFGPPTPMPELERLIFTANQFAGFLTTFYVFVIGLLLVGAFAFAQEGSGRSTAWGSLAGFVAAAVLFSAAIYLTNVTNVRIIQADIVYKQARPLDQQATRSGIAEAWDPPIAIYERALELAPNEDFYYLFLGRALLEKSGVTQDPAAQRQLLETARERLQRAQQINPLNTDHTANLARLATRWASLSTVSEARQGELVTEAKELYRDALALSPQNSVIRNEFGNLLATLDNDCDAAIETFRESLQIDPYYANTYYSLAGIYELCAAEHSPDMRDSYFQRAAELLEEGLDRDRNQNATVLLQASQLYRRAGELESAVTALEQAQELGGGQVPAWNIDFRLAEIYEEMGDSSTAQRLATRALATSPPESQAEIEAFLAELGGR